jgi:subtilisin family serine protease
MAPLDVVRLTPLMERTRGKPQIAIGLVDGPVLLAHPELAGQRIRQVSERADCSQANSLACMHGTFVAGILCAKTASRALAICPDCTLLVRSVFPETNFATGEMPSASPEDLAEAILDCVNAGAHVLNISAAIAQPSTKSERALAQSLDEAARRRVIVVAAAGNQGTLGSTTITSHPWVIPVVAYDCDGRPLLQSNLGGSIGRRGVGAPGDRINSLGVTDMPLTLGGTSAAAPFVTGAVALLWSEFPNAAAAVVKLAIAPDRFWRRATVVPPLLDAWGAYQSLSTSHARKQSP